MTEPTDPGSAVEPLAPCARAAPPRPAPELSLEELFARLSNSRAGRARESGRDVPSELARADLARLARATSAELVARHGLSPGAAERLACAFELGRRTERERRAIAPQCHSAELVHEAVRADLAGLERERFLALLLDGKHRLQRIEQVSEGTLTTSLVHPREVFRAAVRESAAALIAVHNHPSGDPEPSQEDLEVTRRLRRAGSLIGIPLLDHVIVGQGRYVSLRERLW